MTSKQYIYVAVLQPMTLLISGFATIFLIYLSTISSYGINFSYDSLNRLTNVDYGNGSVISYTYDSAGNRLTYSGVVANQFNYTTNNGTITITGYTGPDGAVSIPSTLNGLPVTSIGYAAFASRTSLTSVTIPNSVSSIGSQAFAECTSLTSVTIPNGVTSIGDEAFRGCTSLSAITVDALNSFYSSVAGVLFDKSQTLLIQYPGGKSGSYAIPNSVTNIGDFAFYRCFGLTSVTIPNSVTSIGYAAFNVCISLTSVTIPNSVTSIGDGAFDSCDSLTSVTIPSSVTSIGNGAFEQCYGLSAITVDALNSFYSGVAGVLFNKSQTTLIQCPGGKAGSYMIPNNVTSIGENAFGGCKSLTSVTIPNSVTSIGVNAFHHCTSLTNATIGNGVTSIGDIAFDYCTSLTGVYFQGNAPSIGLDTFLFANNVTVYYLPGTTGWGTSFGGLPTALWKPLVETSVANFGVRTNRFGFNISWASGMVVVVEACTNLANPIWSPLQTNTLISGTSYFIDPQWTNYPGRFYRLRSP
jgi:YD repeat-containing protein